MSILNEYMNYIQEEDNEEKPTWKDRLKKYGKYALGAAAIGAAAYAGKAYADHKAKPTAPVSIKADKKKIMKTGNEPEKEQDNKPDDNAGTNIDNKPDKKPETKPDNKPESNSSTPSPGVKTTIQADKTKKYPHGIKPTSPGKVTEVPKEKQFVGGDPKPKPQGANKFSQKLSANWQKINADIEDKPRDIYINKPKMTQDEIARKKERDLRNTLSKGRTPDEIVKHLTKG